MNILLPYEIIADIFVYLEFEQTIKILENTNYSNMLEILYKKHIYYLDPFLESASGNISAVKFIYTKKHFYINRDIIMSFLKYGNLKDIQWIYYNSDENRYIYLIDYCAKYGNLEAIKWFFTTEHPLYSLDSLGAAILNNDIDMTIWLLDNAPRFSVGYDHLVNQYIAYNSNVSKEMVSAVNSLTQRKNLYSDWILNYQNLITL